MEVVRKLQVPAKLVRETDYVPWGGWVVAISRRTTWALVFPAKDMVTLTFYTGSLYVDFEVEAHIPVDVERISEQVTQGRYKEKK